MSVLDVKCAGCGCDLTLEVPDGDSGAARWLRTMASRARCDTCVATEERQEEARERRGARDARRSRCQLPRSLRGYLLDDFAPRPGQHSAWAAVRDWAWIKDAGSLVLTGPVGTGKTVLAAAACWTRLERWECRYASVARAMARLGASWTDEGRQEAVRFFAGTGAAVLDDLDKTRVTDYGREQLFAAIDGRQQAEAPLLVTTNLAPDQIGEAYGTAIMSRLAAPWCRVVEVGGVDHRVEEAS